MMRLNFWVLTVEKYITKCPYHLPLNCTSTVQLNNAFHISALSVLVLLINLIFLLAIEDSGSEKVYDELTKAYGM